MSVKSYVHFAEEPDRNMPVIMCSFCNEQNLVVSQKEYGPALRPILFKCVDCEYVWEFDVVRMNWEGYSLENGKWEDNE